MSSDIADLELSSQRSCAASAATISTSINPAGIPFSTSRSAPWWRSGRTSLILTLVGLTLAAASTIPARAALAFEQGNGAGISLLYFAGGLLSDVTMVGPFILVAIAALVWLAKSDAGAGQRRVTLGIAWTLLATLLVVSWLGHNGAMQFRLERGIFPGPLDAREGLGHVDFLRAELPRLVLGRFALSNLIAVVAVLALLRWVTRTLDALTKRGGDHPKARVRVIVVFGAALSISIGLGARRANAFCEALHNNAAIASPASALVRDLVSRGSYGGSPDEVRRLVTTAKPTLEDVARGAEALGFDPASAARLINAEAHPSCAKHPLATPLDDEETDLVSAARALSRALFRDRDGLPVVFHVSLESTRADDIHALNEHAPREVAPFLDDVYAGRRPEACAFRHAFQSGVRTAQAIAGVTCGMGALPFHLALGRDLGNVPLRCLPDVLSDAGFQTRAFYGHEFVFDDMGTFFRFHGVALHERRDFPEGAPKGVWEGVSDAKVYEAAAVSSEARAQYKFVLTLSHHTPYTVPSDLDPATRASVDALCEARGSGSYNCDRLKTLHYADGALASFLERVGKSSDARRALVVVAADHSTPEGDPWDADSEELRLSRVPVVVWLPEALTRAARDPSELASAWDRFRAIAARAPISNSDVPRLILALVSESAPLRALPASQRWHTIGGQATSRHLKAPTGGGLVWGIDAWARVFDVDERGEPRHENVVTESLHGAEDVAAAPLSHRPTLALLASLLRGYGAACTQASSIRAP